MACIGSRLGFGMGMSETLRMDFNLSSQDYLIPDSTVRVKSSLRAAGSSMDFLRSWPEKDSPRIPVQRDPVSLVCIEFPMNHNSVVPSHPVP